MRVFAVATASLSARDCTALLPALLASVLLACNDHASVRLGGADSAHAPPPSAHPSYTKNAPEVDEIRPVYLADPGTIEPGALRYCTMVYHLPQTRIADCLSTSSASDISESQCARTLTSALRSGAVRLSVESLGGCASAMERATSGCGWVTPRGARRPLPMPAECDGVVVGRLGIGESCRSSLECTSGLSCSGLSTIDVGRCSPPKPPGQACNLAIDTLAVFARRGASPTGHRECAGHCRAGQCQGP